MNNMSSSNNDINLTQEAEQWKEIEALALLYEPAKGNENDPSVTLAYDLVAEKRLKLWIEEMEARAQFN